MHGASPRRRLRAADARAMMMVIWLASCCRIGRVNMIEASDGKVAGWLRGVGGIVVLISSCAACGLLPGWRSAPVEEVTITSAKVEEEVIDVSATPVLRLVLVPPGPGPTSRLFAVYARVRNVGDEPLAFRPEAGRLLLPDGSSGVVFDRPRAAELIRRTELVQLDAPSADTLREPMRTQYKTQILTTLLDGAYLQPGQEVLGYLVTDTGTSVSSLEGIALEVFATRASDQRVVRDSYQFAGRTQVTGNRGM
jgi:hypothetical protein